MYDFSYQVIYIELQLSRLMQGCGTGHIVFPAMPASNWGWVHVCLYFAFEAKASQQRIRAAHLVSIGP